MSLTVLDNIQASIVTRLETLKNPSAEQTTVETVIAPPQYDGYTPEHLQIVVLQGEPELQQTIPGNPPALEWLQPFRILCHVVQDKDEETPLTELINPMVADVFKVLTNPPTTWHQFDGNSINATFGSLTPIVEGSVRGKEIPLIVTYRVSETDPYEVRA